jgi:hypothetical protein
VGCYHKVMSSLVVRECFARVGGCGFDSLPTRDLFCPMFLKADHRRTSVSGAGGSRLSGAMCVRWGGGLVGPVCQVPRVGGTHVLGRDGGAQMSIS